MGNGKKAAFGRNTTLPTAADKREPGKVDKEKTPRGDWNVKTGQKPNNDHVRLCFRCGQPGHIASNPECPKNGKKSLYAQIWAAHTIILDMISESVGAEEHPRSQSEEEESVPTLLHREDDVDNIEYEIYDAGSEYDNGSNDECINRIEDDGGAMTASEDEGAPETVQVKSEDEIMYGNPSDNSGETMESIPLYYFSGSIPDMVPKPNLAVRMSSTLGERPDVLMMNTMSEVIEAVPQQGRIKLRIQKESSDQPTPVDKRCLVTMLQVNGLDTVTLWDSGSMSTAMSLAFADISKALVSRLRNPVMLQLDTVGSHAQINFGTMSTVTSQGYSGPKYFDVINIDKYDIIMGRLFMHCNRVVLDFERKCVIVNGKEIPGTVLNGEAADKVAQRHCMHKPEEARK